MGPHCRAPLLHGAPRLCEITCGCIWTIASVRHQLEVYPFMVHVPVVAGGHTGMTADTNSAALLRCELCRLRATIAAV